MESLSSNLSHLDDYKIDCSEHLIPSVGVCGDYLCKERKLYCMKCMKNKTSCIIENHHELITLSELIFRFFIKQETKAIDLIEINAMMEAMKEINYQEIRANLKVYIEQSESKIEKKFKNFCIQLTHKINSFTNSCLVKLSNLNGVFTNSIVEKENLSLLVNQKIPDCLIKMNHKSVNEYLKSTSIKNEEKQNLLKMIKFISKKENSLKTIQASDEILSMNNLVKKESYEKIFREVDNKLNELDKKINKHFNDLECLLISKNNTGLSTRINSMKFTGDPNKLIYKTNLCETAHKANSIDSVFCAFKSLKGNTYVVWGTPGFCIEIYDLRLEKLINTITSAHTNTIFSCRHYLDKKNKHDLIITSSYDRSIKVWNASESWSMIVNIQNAHTGYYIYSVCILCHEFEGKNFILSSSSNEFSKIWDMQGKHVKDFGVNTESTYFINTWLDAKNKKYYIINGNSVDVKSFDFKTTKLYKSYKGTPSSWHMSALVNEVNGQAQLIESDGNGNVRVWDFHTATILNTISTAGINLRGISLWNDNYLFSSGSDFCVKLYDLKNSKFVKNFTGHTSTACAVEKVVHPLYGESLITHALDGKLKLWIIK